MRLAAPLLLVSSQLFCYQVVFAAKKTTTTDASVEEEEESTTTATVEVKNVTIRSLECLYQSSLENTQEIARRFLITKAYFPDFNFTIEGGKCSLVNIPDGLHAFCEKRVYDVTMFALPGSSAKILDTRKGCAYSSKLKRDASNDVNSCSTNAQWGDTVDGVFGKFILNGTEVTCRCDKNLCNQATSITFRYSLLMLLVVMLRRC